MNTCPTNKYAQKAKRTFAVITQEIQAVVIKTGYYAVSIYDGLKLMNDAMISRMLEVLKGTSFNCSFNFLVYYDKKRLSINWTGLIQSGRKYQHAYGQKIQDQTGFLP